ncbi:MAG: transcription initiation factor IIB family protein [Candidatus Thorarchaeota archaeon]
MDKALRITESTLPTHKAKSLMTRHDAKEKGSCIECGSEIPIRDATRGELICSQCGLVLSSNLIDLGPEWRAFTKEQSDQRRRVGKPINFARSDKGLTTTLGLGYSDASGRAIPANRRADISRMRKWQQRVQRHTSYERNLAVAMTELSRVTSQMNLPNMVKDSVAIIYRRILSNNLIRGRTIEGIIGACIYIACRTHRIPITLKEISHQSRIKAKKLGRCYRFIMQKFDVRIPLMLPQDFIPRFGEALRLHARVQRRAKEILTVARKKQITSGKAPSGLAAASLYIASILEGDHRTQREIADVAEITEVTIRNRYKELVEKLNL